MFDKLIGNEQIKTILRRMLQNERVPRSLLLTGEDGVGKRRFALELAKAFVCLDRRNSEACDKCSACRRADKFAFPKSDDRDAHKNIVFSEHPDIGQIIPYGKNILVDAVRDIEKEANFRPFEAQARFFLIDDADRMNEAASNALLKTLEEPPPTSYIFLVTARPDALLQTILSRCQTLRFAPVPAAEIKKHLLETKKYAADDAAILARVSSGSIGRALDTDLVKFRERREVMLKVLDSLLVKPNRAVLLKTAEEMNDAKHKEKYEEFLDTLQTLVHDVWALRFGSEEIVNADIRPQLLKFADEADSKRLARWLAEIETMRENFAFNLNKKIATDALFMQMAG